MSDPIADAAEALSAAPSSTEPANVPDAGNVVAQSDHLSPATGAGGDALSAQTPSPTSTSSTMDAATSGATTATTSETDGIAEVFTSNVLVNASPMVDAPNVVPAADAGAQEAGAAPVAGGDVLPRESHLMLLEAKIAGFRAKLANAERVALDEFEAIVAHVRSVI